MLSHRALQRSRCSSAAVAASISHNTAAAAGRTTTKPTTRCQQLRYQVNSRPTYQTRHSDWDDAPPSTPPPPSSSPLPDLRAVVQNNPVFGDLLRIGTSVANTVGQQIQEFGNSMQQGGRPGASTYNNSYQQRPHSQYQAPQSSFNNQQQQYGSPASNQQYSSSSSSADPLTTVLGIAQTVVSRAVTNPAQVLPALANAVGPLIQLGAALLPTSQMQGQIAGLGNQLSQSQSPQQSQQAMQRGATGMMQQAAQSMSGSMSSSTSSADQEVDLQTELRNPCPLIIEDRNDQYFITLVCRGLEQHEIRTQVKNGNSTIVVTGQKQSTQQQSTRTRDSRDEFRRSIRLPRPVHPSQLHVEYKAQVLTIAVDKHAASHQQQRQQPPSASLHGADTPGNDTSARASV